MFHKVPNTPLCPCWKMSDTVLNFGTTVYTSAPWMQENDKQEIDEKLQIHKKIYYLQNWFIFLNFIHNYFALIGSFRSWWSFFYQKKKINDTNLSRIQHLLFFLHSLFSRKTTVLLCPEYWSIKALKIFKIWPILISRYRLA